MTEPDRGLQGTPAAFDRARRERLAALSIPALLLLYLLLTSTWSPMPSMAVFDGKRLLEVHMLAAISVLVLALGSIRRATLVQLARIPSWVRFGLTSIVLLGVVSSLRQPHPAYGLAETGLFALLIFGALATAASRSLAGAAFDRLALGGIALLGLAVSLQELAGILANWSLGTEYSFESMLVNFSHPRFYNQLQTWSMPLLAALPAVFPGRKGMRFVAVGLLALQWCLLLISGGRGSTLSIVAAMAVTAWLIPGPWRKGWLNVHLGGLLAGFLLFWAINLGHQNMATKGGQFLELSVQRSLLNSTGRTDMWRRALENLRSAPWLGVGPMRYQCDAPLQVPSHPHNFPLQLAAERGAPVALLTLAIAAGLFIRLVSGLRRNPGACRQTLELRTALAASVLAAALHSNLSGVLLMPASQVMALLIVGWLAGTEAPEPLAEGPAPAGPGRLWATTLLVTALAVGFWLDAFARREALVLESRVASLPDAGPAQPRFWLYGRSCRYSYPDSGS